MALLIERERYDREDWAEAALETKMISTHTDLVDGKEMNYRSKKIEGNRHKRRQKRNGAANSVMLGHAVLYDDRPIQFE